MKMLDLFSGLGGASKAEKERGWVVDTLDIDPKFHSTFCMSILDVTPEMIKGYDLVWASPPCECFSVMRIGKNWTPDNQPRNEDAKKALEIALHTFEILKGTNHIIENPRAKLRKLAPRPPTVTIWQCQYGERRAKPTDLWTGGVCDKIIWRPECHNGAPDHDRAPRGCNVGGTMDKNTTPEERAYISEYMMRMMARGIQHMGGGQ